MFGAKLSWCQIVRCQIVLVPNCPGAKLSTFIILVPNCPLLLSWCQIVRFYCLGAKLSALLSWCQIVRCQIVLQSSKGQCGAGDTSAKQVSIEPTCVFQTIVFHSLETYIKQDIFLSDTGPILLLACLVRTWCQILCTMRLQCVSKILTPCRMLQKT